MNKNYANNSNNGGMVTSSTGLFSMKGEPQGQGVRTITSSTGIFSMTEEPQPTKIYSTTGLFTTETRMYGKWGKRLLTGAALLGGAALANHIAGDPWGVGAKIGAGATAIGNAIRHKMSGATIPGSGTTEAPSAPATNVSASSAQGASAPKVPSPSQTQNTLTYAKAKNNVEFDKAWSEAWILSKTNNWSAIASKIKELDPLIVKARNAGMQDWAYKLAAMKSTLSSKLPVTGSSADATAKLNDAFQQKQIQLSDAEHLQKFVPLAKQKVDIIQGQWDGVVDGRTNIKPLKLANDARTVLDEIKTKYDNAKNNGWSKSASEYATLYNTLKLVYNNAAEAAKARQEMGK